MPNIPSSGAQGQMDVPNAFSDTYDPAPGLAGEADADDRPSPPATITGTAAATDTGPVSPAHGAAGGYDIDFDTQSVPGAQPQSKGYATGLTTSDPEFGR